MTEKKNTMLHLTPLAEIGGCEVNCLRIIEECGELEHRVLVFARRGPMTERWERAGAKVEHLDRWHFGAASFVGALAEWQRSNDEPRSVIYWSVSRLHAVLGVFRSWTAPWLVYLGNPLVSNFVSRARRFAWEWTQASAGSVTLVACSNRVAASHRGAAYFRRYAMEVIYNAVDPELDRPHDYRELSQGECPKIGMVARLDGIKDHMTVIRALAQASTSRADIIVEFAGTGSLFDDLKEEAICMGVSERVRFLGNRAVGPLLADWDIYVHSTTKSEGMGTAVAEAMMAGLPCVVTDIPVMREVCGPEGAMFVRPEDARGLAEALLSLAADRRRRRDLGNAAKQRARMLFGRSHIAASYKSALGRLTA
jgi:glycosyltransferase involved in cell wall biosynthesis